MHNEKDYCIEFEHNHDFGIVFQKIVHDTSVFLFLDNLVYL